MRNDIEAARAEFEAWAEFRWHPDVGRGSSAMDQDDRGGYFNTAVEYAWRAWQASRATLARPAAPATAVEEKRMAFYEAARASMDANCNGGAFGGGPNEAAGLAAAAKCLEAYRALNAAEAAEADAKESRSDGSRPASGQGGA